MIQGKKRILLSAESILSKISEYDIFKFYMPIQNWKINEATYSPFRTEKSPSFLISYKNQSLLFIDFGDTSLKGNCFRFVQILFNIPSFNDVLIKIDNDFNLGISDKTIVENYKIITSSYKQPEFLEKSYSLIQVKTRKFNNDELQYWNEYYQDIEDLKKNNVYSISKLYLNRKLFPLKETELRFGYFYDGHWKIYKPFENKKYKWVPNNVPITTMDGKENINNSDFAFVNKSKKDYMVMSKIIPNCCAVQNEGIACFSEENVNYLKTNSKKQILSFDSDETGVKNSQLITDKFGFEYCNVPKLYLEEGIKDWALLAKEKGIKKIETILKQKNIL